MAIEMMAAVLFVSWSSLTVKGTTADLGL